MKRGFLYYGRLNESAFKDLLSQKFKDEAVYHLMYELARFHPLTEGLPQNFWEKGQVFSQTAEVRWHKEKEEYKVMLLTEKEFQFKGLFKAPQDFEIEEEDYYLVKPKQAYISPPFSEYPHGAEVMKGNIYKLKGVPILFRAKELK